MDARPTTNMERLSPAALSSSHSIAIPRTAPSCFDFTGHMRRISADMIERLAELSHIDLSRVAVAFSQARNRSQYGLFASLTPLRFRDGSLVRKQRGRQYTVQRVFDTQGREMLYILTFCLPRFMDLSFREKLITILHELWHISPNFDGDIRRHAGRCYAHTGSQKQYDAAMALLADRWLALEPPSELFNFLRCNFSELLTQHGRVVGTKLPRPKLVPVR